MDIKQVSTEALVAEIRRRSQCAAKPDARAILVGPPGEWMAAPLPPPFPNPVVHRLFAALFPPFRRDVECGEECLCVFLCVFVEGAVEAVHGSDGCSRCPSLCRILDTTCD